MPENKFSKLNKVITGRDRSIEGLLAACKEKAELMVSEGVLDISPGCPAKGCGTAHVARIHFSRSEISRTELNAIVVGLKSCGDADCQCHAEHDTVHSPDTEENAREAIGKNYYPDPTAG